MKKLLVIPLLLAAFAAKAQLPPQAACITNMVINCTNDARMLIVGSSNYNSVETYTNAEGMDLEGQGNVWGCDSGTVLTFTVTGCPPTATTVATVTFACSGIGCSGAEGGGCPIASKSFPITMPPYCGYISGRIYSQWGCCTLTWCTLYSNHCDGPPPEP